MFLVSIIIVCYTVVMITLEEIAQKTPKEIQLFIFNLNKENKITLDEKDGEIERLRQQLNQQLQHRFGKSSEKQDNPLQERLFDEVVAPTDECVVEIELADEEITVPEHQRKKRGRKPLPKHLPRVQRIHDLSNTEKQCPCSCTLTQIGQTTTEQLEFIPAQVRVIEHIQLKYACKSCEGTIRQASKPAQPIPKSIATPGLLSHIVVSKFSDHLPFYRQESILQRMDVDIARNTLCHWAIKCRDLLEPIVNRMQCLMNQHDVGYSDETVVQVLNQRLNAVLSIGITHHAPILYLRRFGNRLQDIYTQMDLVDTKLYLIKSRSPAFIAGRTRAENLLML